MRIDFDIDSEQLEQLADFSDKNLAYAVVNAVNDTARIVQRALIAHVDIEFEIRKRSFFLGTPERPGGVAARITQFANVGRGIAFAEVQTGVLPPSEKPQQAQRRLLLPIFEKGGERPSFFRGSKRVAVPITGRPARTSFNRPVDKRFTFAGMRLQAFKGGNRLRTTRGKRGIGLFDRNSQRVIPNDELQYKGRNRTFLLRSTRRAPEGGIFQRFGRGRASIRMVWKFMPPPQLDDRLDWIPIAQAVGTRELPRAMQRQITEMLEHRRIKAIGAPTS